MKKKVFIITGSRAEYGLLKNLISKIKKDINIESKLIVTGSHLSSEFGNTYKEIIKDKNSIYKKIKINLSSDTDSAITNAIGKTIINFSKVFENNKPDIIIILGDRYEILASAIAANFHKILIAHIAGGDTTLASLDESTRHCISKMAYLHFVTNNLSKKRVIQLGENPKRVFNVGHLGTERIEDTKYIKRNILEKILGFNFFDKNILITYHPDTLENDSSKKDFREILLSLAKLKNTRIIFTYPNSDSNGKIIIKMISDFVNQNKDCSVAFKSLGNFKYYQVLNQIDFILGNSSSGILEAPSFKIGTINIGDRQKGRIISSSVIDCKAKKEAIIKSIHKVYSKSFQKKLLSVNNPYKSKKTSDKILNIIQKFDIPRTLKKKFYNTK